ncbi:MAG: flagellar biosynthesis protein FlhB [Epsilonproteobacteria bacterium]|nr:MAG: flagellar biosynthesis protein FlhB [Campylobacterota bacterium]RLA66694.1 MAG: flagellar biosynthesis protein FlhB [Campylobacterota bacterium]
MAEENEDFGEKTEEPSSHRIEEFRKRGEVASSKELTSVLLLTANIITISLGMIFIFEILEEYVTWLYGLDFDNAYSPKVVKIIISKTLFTALKCVAPVFVVSIIISVLSSVGQIGFLWAPKVLEMKPERLNPVEGLKKLISLKSIFEAIKGLMKFSIILFIVYLFFKDKILILKGFLQLDVFQSVLYGKDLIINLSLFILMGMFIVALIDLAYQKFSYQKKIKQTKEQAKREQKEHEGNPEIKQRIRAIQREVSQRRIMQEVPKADVIITNPTHYAVALKYDPETMLSPKVLAKGADHMALRIRKSGKDHEIPVIENITLARNLYKTVKIGEFVPQDLYRAVAEVLAFVYKLKRKRKALIAD